MNLYLENKKFNETEFEEKKLVLQSKPLTLRLILTNQCNINCLMCDIVKQKNKFTIPFKQLKQLISLFPYIERIDWQGGEVFLVEYFKELLQEASNYSNIQQTLQTNGLLLNNDWAEILAKKNVAVLFSIDSTNKDNYEDIRKGARYEDLLENIRIFNDCKKRYKSEATKILCVCVMRRNYMELGDFVDFAIEYGFNQISFGAIHGTIARDENIFNPVDSEAIGRIREKMVFVEKKSIENKINLECSFRPYLYDDNEDKNNDCRAKQDCKSEGVQLNCKLPWTNLCIDAIRGGEVYPECLCSKSMGNIMQDSIMSIWNNPVAQNYRLAIKNMAAYNICSEYCLHIKFKG